MKTSHVFSCLFSFLLLIPTIFAQCGSLVTYRQHADLLQTAPKCLRDGCNKAQNMSSISSSCPEGSPCFVYWNMFVEQFDKKHTWCSSCPSDLACRIQGWPVLNATAVCDTTPNQLLFGGQGCCIEGDEPFQLAEWTGTLCNESEWRQPFDVCGGMACLDWLEWIMPWNWTVHNDLIPHDQQVCKAPSTYLAVYGMEHFFWLFFSLAIGCMRLGIARWEEATDRSVMRYYFVRICSGFTKRYKQLRGDVWAEKQTLDGEALRPTLTEKLRWGFPVIMGVVLAGMQLGFNFWVASLIKNEPGYHHVPLGLLALLFCCRPRLSWLSCLLAQIPDRWLIKVFKFKSGGDGLWAAKLVLSSVAVTSAVTEAIMQLLGAYFLGRTAQVGTERGFYYIHHLRPKLHGRDARHMYLGALFWVLLCIPLLVVWFIVAIFFSQVFHAVSSWRRGIFNFLRPKVQRVPKLAKGSVIWVLDHVNPDHTPMPRPSPGPNPFDDSHAQVMPLSYDPDQPVPIDRASMYDQPMPYGGPGTGDLFSDQVMPARYNSTSTRSRYSRLTQSDFEDQIMPIPRVASGSHRVSSGGYSHGNTSVQRRTPSGNQYNALQQHDDIDEEEDQILPLPSNHRRQPEMTQIRYDGDSHHTLLAPNAQAQAAPPSSSGNSSSPKRSDYTKGVSWRWADWEPLIIFAGAFLGMLAYASQWLFWDGFVKASGDRFCPPDIWRIGGVWWGGALLYVGLPFFGY